jgi:hypothetical protein
MPKGCGIKLTCVIKLDIGNFDEVVSKREDKRHDVYNCSIQLNCQEIF